VLIVLVLLFWLVPADEEEPEIAELEEIALVLDQGIEKSVSDYEADYTILVYMNGSDLESAYDDENDQYYGAASTDIEEMVSGLNGDRVRVVLETGGTAAWADVRIDGQQNQRWLIDKGGFTHLEDVGQRNIGEADTLADFVAWGVEQYPAARYALIFWNHGGGSVLGFGADEWHDNDSLTLDELATGLGAAYERTGQTFELIGFDACLMASVETATLLSPYGSYLVASEELEPGHGWDYSRALEQLSTSSDVDGATLGRWIADSYVAQASDNGQEMNITLSVIDLDDMLNVVTALEAFIQEADSIIASDRSEFYSFANGRSRAEEYGGSSSPEEAIDMVDLLALVRNVSDSYPDTAAALETAVNEAVVYKINSVGRPNANGLSIYFPHRNKAGFTDNLQAFAKLGFSKTYTDFIHAYVNGLQDDTKKLDFVASGEIRFDYNDDEQDEYAPYEVHVDPQDLEEIEQIYAVMSMYADEEAGEDSPLIYLGYDHYVDVDWEQGVIRDDFTGEWLMWDGHFVGLDLISQGDSYIRYAIPVKLNGNEMDVLVHYDVDADTFELMGAWAGIGSETGMPDKNIIQIKAGDRVIPQYYYYSNTDEGSYIDGDEFVVGDNIDLSYELLPNGTYLYGFSLISYGGVETMTDFIDIELTD
jgi:hypothetical protein